MTVDSIITKINKKYGADTIIKGAALASQRIERVTTGSLAYDLALGGGWPLNQWHEIIGEESSGKTVVALKTIAANQALNKKFLAVWVAAESLPMEWAEKLGVDLKRLIVLDTNVMEEVFDTVLVFLESREVDCVVIDSLPALVPAMENEQLMEDFAVGVHARLTGKFTRKGRTATKRSLVERERPVFGLAINQWRSKIGVQHGDPRTTPGGQAKNYFFDTRTEARRSEWLEAEKLRIGQRIACRVFKNKSAPGQRVGEFDFYFAEGGPVPVGSYDSLTEVVNLGTATGAIERHGRYYHFLEERIADGRENLFEVVRNDGALYEAIRQLVLYGVVPTPPKAKANGAAKKTSGKYNVKAKRG